MARRREHPTERAERFLQRKGVFEGRGVPGVLAQHSLSIVMFGLFALFLMGQSIAGHRAYNQEQGEHQEPAVGYGAYLTEGHFMRRCSRTGRASSSR